MPIARPRGVLVGLGSSATFLSAAQIFAVPCRYTRCMLQASLTPYSGCIEQNCSVAIVPSLLDSSRGDAFSHQISVCCWSIERKLVLPFYVPLCSSLRYPLRLCQHAYLLSDILLLYYQPYLLCLRVY